MQPGAELVSGEGVQLHLNKASAGSRTVAALLDLVIQTAGGLVLLFVTALLGTGGDPAAVQALLIVELVLVLAGYPIGFEWLTRGRTPGKMAMGLRVVRDDGGPISFRHALIRGLAGLFLEKPGILGLISAGIGLVVLLLNSRDKRIGDLMAGTFVLNERSGSARAAEQVLPTLVPPPHLVPWAQILDLSRLDTGLALALRQFLVRAAQMTPAARAALENELRARLEAVITPPPPPGTPTPWYLVTVAAERRRRTESRV